MNAPPTRQPFSFTRHAIDRFISRVWPALANRPIADDREVLSLLCAAARTAEVLPRRSPMGHAMWVTRDPAMRWITKPDEIRGRRVAVVVTVLGPHDAEEAEEQAERDVLEAHRRLTAIPELGLPQATLPPPAAELGSKAYRAWVALEEQRLRVERERLATLRKVAEERNPALAYARIQHQRITAEQQAAARRERTARHLATQARDALFRELLARLAEVDPAGSAELLERARVRVAKWEAEGKAMLETPAGKEGEP